MFATNLAIELPIDASVIHNDDYIRYCNAIIDEKYQQMYTFLKASVESAIILNVVEERSDNASNGILILQGRFLSDTLESAQQFQNSTDFQQVFVQLFQSHGATVSVTTENDVTLDSDNSYANHLYELVSVSVPNFMWERQFPVNG